MEEDMNRNPALWSSLALCVLSMLGCASPLEPGFADTLTEQGGCGDVVFYAVDERDETMLVVESPGLIQAAFDEPSEAVSEFTLPDAEVVLRLTVGRNVSDTTCDDAVEDDGPAVDMIYRATSGSVRIEVRPGATSAYDGATADLFLQEVVFEPEGGGGAVSVESFEILYAVVGWAAG